MPEPANRAVFISYAREDTEPARRIADALRAVGVEAWFDQSELIGGDAWDAKIRRQIRDCALFVPLISANTQARGEGYFRLEWHLAEQRSHLFAKGRPFIVPVSVDATTDREALVPDAFLAIQWMPCTDADSTIALARRIRELLEGGRTMPPMPFGSASVEVAPKIHPKSVAVLAFSNMSHDPENEYFSDGISEELLNVLSKVPGLQVAARTSAFFFKGKQVSVPEIAQKLGVAYVVEGSVRRAGARVRITAQLIKATDGFHMWSDNFDRELKDIFAVQDEIAGLIAKKLQLQLLDSARGTKAMDPEAHRLHLEGRHFRNLHLGNEDGFTRAIAAFSKALEIDPEFAEAHSGLAEASVMRANARHWVGIPDTADDIKRTHASARRAIELDPSIAEAYAASAYGLMLDRDLAGAERQFKEAVTRNPNSAVSHCWNGLLLGSQGRLDLAINEFKKSRDLDPLRFINVQMLVRSLINAQRFDEALKVNTQTTALQTDVPVLSNADQAQILAGLGRYDEALVSARFIREKWNVPPRWQADSDAVSVLRRAGAENEAREFAAEIFSRWPPNFYLRGFVLGALGRFDEALPFLERTPILPTIWLYWDPMWDPFRDDPRFAQLIAKLGRAEEYKVARATLARMRQEQAAMAKTV